MRFEQICQAILKSSFRRLIIIRWHFLGCKVPASRNARSAPFVFDNFSKTSLLRYEPKIENDNTYCTLERCLGKFEYVL